MHVLINPRAGAAEAALPAVRAFAQCSRARLHLPADRAALAQAAAAIRRDAPLRVVVAGGDGTLNHLVAALAPDLAGIELAIVPLGSGNDLARSLDVPLGNVDAALQLAVEGSPARIDLIRVAGAPAGWALNAVSGGFGGDVSSHVTRRSKHYWGALAYWLASLTRLVRRRQYRVAVTLDDQRIERPLAAWAIANGRSVGGGFAVAPQAYLNDGLLDVLLVPHASLAELLAAGFDFLRAGGRPSERLVVRRARRIQFAGADELPLSIDGESCRARKVEFEVVPAALEVVGGPRASLVPID